jgi:hypothetical protein
MKVDEVEAKLIENGIHTINIARISENENFNYYLFVGKIEEYFEILIENHISSVFIEKLSITEDDFLYLLDDEDEEIVFNDSQFEIDEEIGAIKMDKYNPELKEYTKYIETVRGYRIIAIINGKELVAIISQEWSDKFIGQHLSTVDQIEERIESLKKSMRHKKIKK